MPIIDKYNDRADKVHSLVCVGLDSDIHRLPEPFRGQREPQFAFNRWIIDQTHEYAAAYKPNIAFYEARGDAGLRELKLTTDYLREHHPDVFLVCDAKRGDNGATNQGYVAEIFDWLGFDAVTLHPTMGRQSLAPFLDRADKGCIILGRTSNPGDGEFLDMLIADGQPLWQVVARRVAEEWNTNQNCLLVVGATQPQEMRAIRALVGDMTFLVPGVGSQGGDVAEAVRAGLNSDGKGMIINASRSIIFAEHPAEAARQLRDDINAAR